MHHEEDDQSSAELRSLRKGPDPYNTDARNFSNSFSHPEMPNSLSGWGHTAHARVSTAMTSVSPSTLVQRVTWGSAVSGNAGVRAFQKLQRKKMLMELTSEEFTPSYEAVPQRFPYCTCGEDQAVLGQLRHAEANDLIVTVTFKLQITEILAPRIEDWPDFIKMRLEANGINAEPSEQLVEDAISIYLCQFDGNWGVLIDDLEWGLVSFSGYTLKQVYDLLPKVDISVSGLDILGELEALEGKVVIEEDAKALETGSNKNLEWLKYLGMR
ncbi:hypothetical protein Dda_8967 [Drechslerella dactyloides]|uniref:Uncharacterized protein n=1 Tax=Drechslerella dactyloides TaxID=74499 RepID=A0AAD6NFG7_DREDA|nr:hypothetical protein Dda_8967 [Drechslerella dactyloides]